jgi:tryptophan synthase alpha chain
MPIRFDHKPGLVVYLTAGDPSLDATREIAIAAIDAGADVIELGVPFSDPLADGPIIQRASERALAQGTRLSGCASKVAAEIRAARSGRGAGDLQLISIPSCAMGCASLPTKRRQLDADGVLVTDLIVEEADEYLAEMSAGGTWRPFFLAAPTSPDERLRGDCEAHSKGFIYAISRVGITGTQQSLTERRKRLWSSAYPEVSRRGRKELAGGFGVRHQRMRNTWRRWRSLRMRQ